mgnify:CR=1 FL=1
MKSLSHQKLVSGEDAPMAFLSASEVACSSAKSTKNLVAQVSKYHIYCQVKTCQFSCSRLKLNFCTSCSKMHCTFDLYKCL